MTPIERVRLVTRSTGFTQAAGVEVIAADPGHVVLRLASRPDLQQFNRHFHGGVIAGLADHAAGAAATTALPETRIAVTVDMHVNFLHPADGPAIVAAAHVIRTGSLISVVSVDVTVEGSESRGACAMAIVTLRAVDAPNFR